MYIFELKNVSFLLHRGKVGNYTEVYERKQDTLIQTELNQSNKNG